MKRPGRTAAQHAIKASDLGCIDVPYSNRGFLALIRSFHIIEIIEAGLLGHRQKPDDVLTRAVLGAAGERHGMSVALEALEPHPLHINSLRVARWAVLKPKVPREMSMVVWKERPMAARMKPIDIAVLIMAREVQSKLVVPDHSAKEHGAVYLIPTLKIRVETGKGGPLEGLDAVLEQLQPIIAQRTHVRDIFSAVVTNLSGGNPESPTMLAEAVSLEMRMSVMVIYWKQIATYGAAYSAIHYMPGEKKPITGPLAQPNRAHKAIERELRRLIADALAEGDGNGEVGHVVD